MARYSFVIRTLVCPTCELQHTLLVDRSPGAAPPQCATCAVELVTLGALAPKSPTVVDDVLWGGPQYVHNITDDPVWVETKSQYRALLAAHNMKQRVRHVPVPGTDKSPITQSWNIGLPAGVDPRPMCMLSPEEQQARRVTEAKRLGFTVDELAAIDETTDLGDLVVMREPTPACEFFPD
jgi:hypothetical protein